MAKDDTKEAEVFTNIPFIPMEEPAQDFENIKSLQMGFGSKVMRADEQGLWLGAEEFANAPFSVDMEGNVVASSITLVGYIEDGGAAADINGNPTTVSGGKLTAGSVTADKITVSSLSALSANIGTITAGSVTGITITGSLIRTATSGDRIEMDTTNTNQIRFYNASTLYGMLEVDKVGTDGYIRLWAYDEGGGMEIDTGIGASGFNAVTLFSNGGEVFTNGNASNGYVGFTAKNGGSFYVHGGASGDEIITDIEWSSDLIPFSGGSYDLGSSSKRWSTIYVNALNISGSILPAADATYSLGGVGSTWEDIYINDDIVLGGINQPRTYIGYISGTSVTKSNNSFTVTNPSTGNYTVTHNLASTNYTVQLTVLRASGTGAYIAKLAALNSNTFDVIVFNDAGTSVDSDFMFTLTRNT